MWLERSNYNSNLLIQYIYIYIYKEIAVAFKFDGLTGIWLFKLIKQQQ